MSNRFKNSEKDGKSPGIRILSKLRIPYSPHGKRVLDLIFSISGLAVAFPVLIMSAVLIRLDSEGPVIFRQDRIGKNGRRFTAFKLRTMTHIPRVPDREIFGKSDGVTRTGYYLRRFKLDELPQLWNVAKGDMALVGPRPILPEQLPGLDEYGVKRLAVRPGLTGLAQVNGSIWLSWPERWRYDAKYVKKLSFFLDMRIIFKTAAVVVSGEDRLFKKISER